MSRLGWLMLVGLAGCAAIGQGVPPLDPAFAKYVHDTIPKPLPDLLRLGIPDAVRGQSGAALGRVDVTQPPFSADPSGQTDSTKALQAAIDFARDHQMVCFFPPGTYLVSDTLTCIQNLYRRTNGRVFGGNRFPNLLVGSTAGPALPRILLAPRATGFRDPAKPKIMVYVWARGYLNETTQGRVGDGQSPETEQPNISMNQMLVNLEFAIGEGNPGAVVVRHQAAEGSAIENCVINATGGHTGLQGGIGSGGGSHGVTVIGGRYGLDFSGYMSGTQPTPTITGFTLQGQTEAAIRSTSRQTLVAAGLKIIADRAAGPLIQVPDSAGTNVGDMSLIDAEIRFQGDALRQAARTVVSSDRGVMLHNVWVQHATAVVRQTASTTLPGTPDGWLHVQTFAAPARPQVNQQREYRYPVYRDGQSVSEIRDLAVGGAPPADLQSRHLPPEPFPTAETPGAVIVTAAPYHAKGDGEADDTAALQRAIDEHEVVVLPRGCFRISRTLQLKPNTKLIGMGQHLTFLTARSDGDFADPARPAPLVRTVDSDQASTVLAFLCLWAPRDHLGVAMLDWRCGGRSVWRAVELYDFGTYGFGAPPRGYQPGRPAGPLVVIRGHGGGLWYNYRGERLVIDGATGPLNFYQFSPQQVTSELRNARRVAIFGTKYEGNGPMLTVRDCDHIGLFGHGGNGKGRADNTLFVFERTPNFLFANAVDGPTKIGAGGLSHPDGSTDPKLWHMLFDDAFKLPPLERPVLYLKGEGW